MPRRSQGVERVEGFVRDQWNRTFNDVAKEIAREMGRDSLPMDFEHFDYFGRGSNVLKGMSPLREGDLDHATVRVLSNLIFHVPKLPKGQAQYAEEQKYKPGEKTRRGPIYNYKEVVDKKGVPPEKYPFNRFFSHLFKKRGRNEIDRIYKTGRFRDIQKSSLSGGGEFEEHGPGGAISVGVLEDPSSPNPSARAIENEERKFLDETVPGQLALIENERDSKILKVFYQMFVLGHAKLWEVGEKLDQLGEYDSDYWPKGGGVTTEGTKIPWSKSTLSKYQDTIIELMQQYYREEKRKKHPEALTPEQQKAIFQSRRARRAEGA